MLLEVDLPVFSKYIIQREVLKTKRGFVNIQLCLCELPFAYCCAVLVLTLSLISYF